jgi:mono/diheme cytochrome c family protein
MKCFPQASDSVALILLTACAASTQSIDRWRRALRAHEKIASVIFRLKIFCIAIFILAAFSSHPLLAANQKADEQAGALLFRDKGCAYCHGAGGTGGKKGPDLSDIRVDKLWTPDKITNQILNGGQKMPPFSDSLTDAEIAQLVAYLRAKHRPVPPPSATPPPPPH